MRIKTPHFSLPSTNKTSENVCMERYNLGIIVSVQYVESLKYRVINVLINNFEVISKQLTPLRYPVKKPHETQAKHMTFELQANEDMGNKEFKSKEEFNVT